MPTSATSATSATPARYFTLPGGGKLRGDAAASYLRMRAAGMPAGGIDVFYRSLEKQSELRRLYESNPARYPLAARPNKNAPHYRGVAIDFHTTSGGIFDPSAPFLWATKGGKGQLKPQLGERLQAHAFGWRRTVPSERWHFAYDPRKDTKAKADLAARLKVLGFKTVAAFQKSAGLTADGVAGPATWTALLSVKPGPPKPPTPPPGDLAFTFALAAQQAKRWGDAKTPAEGTPTRGEYLSKSVRASIYVTTETSEADRTAILKVFGGAWKVYPTGWVAVLFDSKKWTAAGRDARLFGTAYHGAVRAELLGADGRKLDVIGLHPRPTASYGGDKEKAAEGKQREIASALTMLRKGAATIVAGDFNTSDTSKLAKAGLIRATPARDSVDVAGVQVYDQVWVTPDLIVRTATQLDPGDVADHLVWKLGLTRPSTPSPL